MSEFQIKGNGKNWYGFFSQLEKLGFVHGFTCRMNGESDISPQSLNLALHVHDAPAKVIDNRKDVANLLHFPLENAVTCEQVHGSKIAIVDKNDKGKGIYSLQDTIPGVDGLVTAEQDIPLMLFYADCVPILLADTKYGISAVLHAGWRGSLAEITKKAIRLMSIEFDVQPQNIIAGIGPSIGPCCYEVDAFIYEQGASSYVSCFHPTTSGHWQLDLPKVNKMQLLQCGVPEENILAAETCTADNQQLFFSHRAEQGKTGRFAAIIYRK